MKKFKNRLLLISICSVIAFFMVFFVFNKKESFSEEENRYLSSFKISELSDYVSDHFPLRNKLIALKNNVELLTGKTMINDIYIGKDDYLISRFENTDKNDAIINVINEFAETNENVDVMIVPDSITINEDKLNYHPPIDEDRELDYVFSRLECNYLDVRDELFFQNRSYNNQYYRTDHHWTSFGAYTAYSKYMEYKGKEPLSLDEMNMEKVSSDFLGTSSSMAIGIAKKEEMYMSKKDLDLTVEYVNEGVVTDTMYNLEYLNKKDKYAAFFDNNHALIKVTNNSIHDGSGIAIIKNSYANSFAPFIVNNYQYVYLIDLRYFSENVSDFIKENGIEDILILYNLNNLYSDLSIVKLK